jgi:single-strand DNA-binding protein
MNETWLTVVGNVASDVNWRRIPNGGEVANFRLMSTARRYDSESGSWQDGPRVAVSVACWRRLGENVRTCVAKGDPVVVHGRLQVREYEVDGVRRSSTEIEARSVGLDLARVSAKVVPADAAVPGRSIVDVTGLAVVDAGTSADGADESLVGTSPAGSDLGEPGGGEPVLRVEDGELGEPSALAS